jgi:excisionase family DNA binding protein
MLTVKEAANRLGVSHSRVGALVRQGRIKATKVGPMWLIAESEVAGFVPRASGKPGHAPKPK